MFVDFFVELRDAGVPVSLKEYLTLMEAMRNGVAGHSVDHFYYLSRAALVKDERNLDRFDRVFGHVFRGLEPPEDGIAAEIPEEWLRKLAELPHRAGENAHRAAESGVVEECVSTCGDRGGRPIKKKKK